MLGAMLVAASVVMRLLTRHDPANITRLGMDVVAAGVAFGLVVLVVFAIARIGTAGRSRPSAGTADHRRGTIGPQPAASHETGKSSGRGTPQGQRQDRLRAGAPAAGGGHGGRDGGARSGRPPVLKPTNVYSPGGLLDVPRDGRAPGTPGAFSASAAPRSNCPDCSRGGNACRSTPRPRGWQHPIRKSLSWPAHSGSTRCWTATWIPIRPALARNSRCCCP